MSVCISKLILGSSFLNPFKQGLLGSTLEGEAGLAFDRRAGRLCAVGAVHRGRAAGLNVLRWECAGEFLNLGKKVSRKERKEERL